MNFFTFLFFTSCLCHVLGVEPDNEIDGFFAHLGHSKFSTNISSSENEDKESPDHSSEIDDSSNRNLSESSSASSSPSSSVISEKKKLTSNETEELNGIFESTSESISKEQKSSSENSSDVSSDGSTFGGHSSTNSDNFTDTSQTSSSEKEDVVVGTLPPPTQIPLPKTIIQKTLEWMNDTYTLSVALPVAAGIVFATTIIMTIAVCSCIRRRCRRRRLRRKILPDTMKNIRPSDRARLLAESSDEEF